MRAVLLILCLALSCKFSESFGQVAGWENVYHGTDTVRAGALSRLLLSKSGNLLMCGSFSFGGATAVNGVAQWDDTALSLVGSAADTIWNHSWPGILSDDSSGNLYATGSYGNTGQYFIGKWDGQQWSRLGSGTNVLDAQYTIQAMCANKRGDVYAATYNHVQPTGQLYLAKWDGQQWSVASNYSIGRMIQGDDSVSIYATGFSFRIGNTSEFYIVRYDGTTWAQVGPPVSPLNGNNGIDALYKDAKNNLYAAVSFSSTTGQRCIMKWDGQLWSSVGSCLTVYNGSISTMYCDTATNEFYVGGGFQNTEGCGYVLKWNGSTWAQMGINEYSISNNSSNSRDVLSLIKGRNNVLYAAGGFVNSGKDIFGNKYRDPVAHLARYNEVLPSLGIPKPDVKKFAVYPNPAKDVILIRAMQSASFDRASLKLTDVLGRTVREYRPAPRGTATITIDVADVPPGAYFISVYNNGQLQYCQSISIR